MLDDLLFVAANAAVVPVWLLMLLAPNRALTQRLVRPLVAPAVVAGLYVAVLLANVGATEGNFFTLDGVRALFTDRSVVLVGWIHYLAFDLVVGSWIFRDAQRRGMRHVWLAPCLVLTLMFGPSGLLAYLLAGRWRLGRWPALG